MPSYSNIFSLYKIKTSISKIDLVLEKSFSHLMKMSGAFFKNTIFTFRRNVLFFIFFHITHVTHEVNSLSGLGIHLSVICPG